MKHREPSYETNAQSGERQEKDPLQDLWRVGPDKPLGYLPTAKIVDECGEDVSATQQALTDSGLKTILFNDGECLVYSGALYVYDEAALEAFLAEHADIVAGNNWPTDPESFVRCVSSTNAAQPELYKVVAWAFADERPEYQRPS